LLVEEGKVPYGYELTARQKADLAEADLVVWVGPELERFLQEPIKEVKADALVITLLDNPKLKVLPSRWNGTERDPFFWLDSRNVIIMADELTRELMAADAARAHLYMRNRNTLQARLSGLDRRLEYGYRGLKNGIGMAYYDTLQYFEQAYALKIRKVIARSPRKALDAENLLKGRVELAEGLYACLLTESNMAMPELALLTGGIEINFGELDSFGSNLKPGPNLYFELMEHNTRVIKRCLLPGTAPPATVEADPTPSEIGGKFMLVDHNGNLVTEKDLRGKFQMLYFGYTFCPDICPTSLQIMSMALDMLGEKAERIQPYFITIDPERDTVEVMKNYVTYYNKRLIGLTGSRNMIDRVARQFKVRFEKVIEEGMDPELYAMDHTASVFLMAPDGSFLAKFAHGISSEQMVEKINGYIPGELDEPGVSPPRTRDGK
jgi:protein SCO1/2